MFKKEINPFPVSDKVTFRNIDKTLDLTVRSDASSLVLGLKRVNERLNGMTDDSPEADRKDAARFFADTLFGKDQGGQLCEFYGEPLAVITACGMYFRERLAKKISKAQKK
jgi:hypothetical protein